ncbi:hypothetical protein [Paenibacillus methanolicus]|uniref:Uncharacterized protein n=1 Tax=Paenibacillus methanolicus TaxID=582686 RepID=A0A5S5C0N8_9BACL|nr:hypothetical protein [Paenibacillus methanolicus]TYP72022.1 hypothetical protein BCM02_109301 [Paenibacillus methanolicus]
MPNFDVFGNINSPVVTEGIGGNGIRSGVLYYANTNPQNTSGSTSFLALQLSNPTTAVRQARIVRVFGGAFTNTILHYIRNGTLNGGVTLNAYNGNFSYPDISQMIPTFIATNSGNPVTGGVTLASFIQVGGPVTNEVDGRVMLSPGDRFIVLLQNAVAGNNIQSIAINWIEK